MRDEFAEIGELEGHEETFYETAEKELTDKLNAYKDSIETDHITYRKTLLQFVEYVCSYEAEALDLFYNHNWKAVVEHSLFNDKRTELKVMMNKLKGVM